MLSVVGRIILVPFAFLLSTAVALFVLVTLGSERITHAIQGTDNVSASAAFELLGQAVLLTSAMTILPALALIIIGEVARIRSIYYYVVGGGLALVAVPALAQVSSGGALEVPEAIIWQVFATAGFLGGFVYWLLAGRNA